MLITHSKGNVSILALPEKSAAVGINQKCHFPFITIYLVLGNICGLRELSADLRGHVEVK